MRIPLYTGGFYRELLDTYLLNFHVEDNDQNVIYNDILCEFFMLEGKTKLCGE